MPRTRNESSPAGGRSWSRSAAVAIASSLLVGGCSAAATIDPAAVQPSQPSAVQVNPVGLGTAQRVAVSSSFGPGTADVRASITVLRFRDHVRASDRATPVAPATHWASAEVRVCRSTAVELGYPAWVLRDDDGRTAQVTKVLHPGFPQPSLPVASHAVGCTRGWVTWVTPDDLHATEVTFEQTREVPGAWLLR